MAGFDNDVVYGTNVDFTGTSPVSGQITLDGELLIGATSAPFIRSGFLTGSGGITITNGPGTINIDATSAIGVTSVSGTANRITSTGGSTPVIDISAAYVGQTSLTTLGTITTGTWNGSTVTVPFGGTGATTLTNHGVLLGQVASAIVATTAGTNGQVLVGSTGADPVFATLGAGTGISYTTGAGTLTINATGGGITWTDVTGTSQNAAVNNGYVANNAGLVTITLPAAFAVGDIVRVAGLNTGLWKLAANTGDIINFGSSPTSAGGSLTATNRYDSIEVVGVTANTTWVVLSAVGNLTVA